MSSIAANAVTLRPYRESVLPGMALSVFAHGCIVLVVAVVAVYTSWTTPKRIIDPDTTIQVSIVSLPKSEKAIPDKASRAPVPQGR